MKRDLKRQEQCLQRNTLNNRHISFEVALNMLRIFFCCNWKVKLMQTVKALADMLLCQYNHENQEKLDNTKKKAKDST